MKMTSSAGSFQDPVAGTYPGVCIGVIDLGTQEGEYDGKKTLKRQLMLRFELHGEAVDSDGNGYMTDEHGKLDPMKPFVVSAWLRDDWIAAENARVAVYKAFMEANRHSSLAKELVQAEQIEKQAKDAYAKALRKEEKESPDGTDTRI